MVDLLLQTSNKIRSIRYFQLITCLLVLLHPLFLYVGILIAFLMMIGSTYKIKRPIEKYVRTHHLSDLREFQKNHKIYSMAHQYIYYFMKSEYFRVCHEEDEIIMNTYKLLEKEKLMLRLQAFVCFIIMSVSL
ncbi:MAG: hypothetical protein JEZ08_22335 [Clostridiales bacterium]|nr:hypothetical protein [Clostridiales bacterium]